MFSKSQTLVQEELVSKKLKNVQQHSRFWTKYFRETLLRPQRMVAELSLTDPLLELTIGGVLAFGVFRSES